jgi:DNA processing protein
VWGDEGVLTAPSVAIVGSRAVGADTVAAVTEMAAALAGVGLVVVSGLARGVDAAAHQGAVERGRTVAVLGSSVDRLYPAEHDALATLIVRGGGALVSEWPPGTPARRHHFPVRNRVISGLSRGVVVAEASETSGALITARHALEQGREVMAMPGPVWGGRNRGAHALIKDGAPLVEDAADVLSLLFSGHALDDWVPSGTPAALSAVGLASGGRSGPLLEASAEERTAVALGRLGRATADELRAELGWPTGRILAVLADLELEGRAVRVAGGWILARER